MKALNPGDLRHQITWQRRNVTGARNSFGREILGSPEYANVVTCRAQIESGAGKEVALAQQVFAEAKYVIRQHFSAGLTPALRISWYIQGQVRTLDVLDIQDECGLGRVLKIIAKDHVE